MSRVAEAVGVALVFGICFLAIMLAFSYQHQETYPSGEFTKQIQVKVIYPRVDAYMNHNPPYIITKEGEIYNVNDDLLWAKFNVDGDYKIRYAIVKISGRTGEIHGIEEKSV